MPPGSIEVPCHLCGHPVVLARHGQRIAQGKPERLIHIRSGEVRINDAQPPPTCLWCAFADNAEVMATMPPKPLRKDAQ